MSTQTTAPVTGVQVIVVGASKYNFTDKDDPKRVIRGAKLVTLQAVETANADRVGYQAVEIACDEECFVGVAKHGPGIYAVGIAFGARKNQATVRYTSVEKVGELVL